MTKRKGVLLEPKVEGYKPYWDKIRQITEDARNSLPLSEYKILLNEIEGAAWCAIKDLEGWD